MQGRWNESQAEVVTRADRAPDPAAVAAPPGVLHASELLPSQASADGLGASTAAAAAPAAHDNGGGSNGRDDELFTNTQVYNILIAAIDLMWLDDV